MDEIGPYPVCPACLAGIKPLSADSFCAVCRTPFSDENSLDAAGRCDTCREGSRGFDAAYSYGAYDGDLRRLVHLFKYARIRSLEKPLGLWLDSALPRDERFDLIVPVPIHWRRRWTRGFNQAERIARIVSLRTGASLWTGLKRVRGTPAQAGLSRAQRHANMARVFAVSRSGAGVRGKRLLLIDDVYTTGATATACALALKKAGAHSVVLLTLARVDHRWADVPDGLKFSGAS